MYRGKITALYYYGRQNKVCRATGVVVTLSDRQSTACISQAKVRKNFMKYSYNKSHPSAIGMPRRQKRESTYMASHAPAYDTSFL